MKYTVYVYRQQRVPYVVQIQIFFICTIYKSELTVNELTLNMTERIRQAYRNLTRVQHT